MADPHRSDSGGSAGSTLPTVTLSGNVQSVSGAPGIDRGAPPSHFSSTRNALHPASRDPNATCEDRKVGPSSSHRSRRLIARSRPPSCPRWPHYLSKVRSPRPHTQPINEDSPPPDTTDLQCKPRCARRLAGLDRAADRLSPRKVLTVMTVGAGSLAVLGNL